MLHIYSGEMRPTISAMLHPNKGETVHGWNVNEKKWEDCYFDFEDWSWKNVDGKRIIIDIWHRVR